MKLYIPVHDRGWTIHTVESEDVRILHKNTITSGYSICRWKERVGFYGPIYNSYNIFTSEEDAWAWINKDYTVANKVFKDFRRVGE